MLRITIELRVLVKEEDMQVQYLMVKRVTDKLKDQNSLELLVYTKITLKLLMIIGLCMTMEEEEKLKHVIHGLKMIRFSLKEKLWVLKMVKL